MNRLLLHFVCAVGCGVAWLPCPQVSAVTLEWIRQSGGALDDGDRAIAADPLGNAFIANYSQDSNQKYRNLITKYDDAGNLQWSREIIPSPTGAQFIAADSSGNAYVTSCCAPSSVTKIDSAGNPLWSQDIISGGATTRNVATDRLGYVYALGSTSKSLGGPPAGQEDAFVVKYDFDGNLLWKRQLGTSMMDIGYGVSADGLGNVYISGTTNGSLGGPYQGGGTDAFLAKYDSAGALVWTRQFGTSKGELSVDVSTDLLGNVFIGGTAQDAQNQENEALFVAKYDAYGSLQWSRELTMSAGSGVATDGFGNVYVSGGTIENLDGPNLGDSDLLLAKYGANGTLLWTRTLGSFSRDASRDVAVDGRGGVYVSGYTWGGIVDPDAGLADLVVAKFLDSVPEPSTISLVAVAFAVLTYRSRVFSKILTVLFILTIVVLPTHARADIRDGLVGYWPFDGNGADGSGFGRDLTLQGGVGFAAGLFGQAIDMHKDQTTYAQRLSNDAAFNFGVSDFTIQTWANYYSTETEQVFIEKFSGASGPGWTFTKRAEQWVHFAGGGFHSSSPRSITTEAWHYFVARRSGNQLQIILDSQTILSRTIGPISDSTNALYIGRRNPSDVRDFSMNGRLDDVAIWNRALSDAEISHLYNDGTGSPVIPIPEPGTISLAMIGLSSLRQRRIRSSRI